MKKFLKRVLASVMVVFMLLSFAPLNEAYAEYLKDLDIGSWFAVKADALDDIPSISCDIEWDENNYEYDASEEEMLNRSEINYMEVDDGETFSTYSSGSDYSDNATTYTVLLLDIESAHNMLTYNGEYLCTLGSPVKQVKAAALKLIDQIKLTRGTTHVAIVTFCKNVRVVQNFTTDYYTMRKAIENITEDTAWTDVNGAFKKADELLSSVSETNVDKNIVLFTQGVPYSGEYSSSGRYTINDCSWKRTDNNIYAYQYSNSAYATAEALKSKYNIYSIGLYQSYEGIPEQGKSMLNFAKRVNQDIQNKGYYDVTNVDDLEFSFSQDVFNLAVAIDTDLIYIPVRALDSSGNEVPLSGAQVTIYQGDKEIYQKPSVEDGFVHFSRQELYNKGVSERSLKKCTVSAHYSVGEIELCSEEITPKGVWRGTEIKKCIDEGVALVCDEPRWYVPALKVMVNREALSECQAILKTYSEMFAQTTNGHVIVNDFDMLVVSNSDVNLTEEILIKKAKQNQVNICMVKNGDDGASGAVVSESLLERGHLDHSVGGYQNKVGLIWAPINGTIDDMARTLCHESGHYLLGFWDEYCSAIGAIQAAKGYWEDDLKYTNFDEYIDKYLYAHEIEGEHRNNKLDIEEEKLGAVWNKHKYERGGFKANVGFVERPKGAPENFGVMELQQYDLEMSTKSTYDNIEMINDDDYSFHYYYTDASCEEKLAHELEKKLRNGNCTYSIKYSYATKTQDAEYFFAGGDNVNFGDYTFQTASSPTQDEFVVCSTETPVWLDDMCNLNYLDGNLSITSRYNVDITVKDFNDKILLTSATDENNSFVLDCEKDGAYILVLRTEIDELQYQNEYLVNCTEGKNSVGFNNQTDVINLYSTQGDPVITVTPRGIKTTNGGYFSISDEYTVLSDNKAKLTGTIERFIGFNLDIDYSTISWFKKSNNEWTALETTIYYKEPSKPIVSCEYSGNGTYCLMAKSASDEKVSVPTNFNVVNTGTVYNDEVVITFEDSSNESLYYNIYYGTEPITMFNYLNMKNQTVDGNYRQVNIFLEDNTTPYYFAIQAVGKNGAKSELSECVTCTGALLDSNNDGLPDSWLNQYGLKEDDDLPELDPDDDGLDNLTEYEYGTNPLNPDTDGDNVYDKVELLKGLDPLNPMTDGATDDYVVAYGTPDLEICEITFDDDYIYFSVKNDTDSKAMRTIVEARVQDETIALWTVNVDEHSIVQFAIDRTAAEDWTGLVLEADGGKLTHDYDYSNNAFTYSAANAISLEDTEMVKRTSQSFAPATEPDGANDIYRWSVTEGNCLVLNTLDGEFTANRIGQATIQAETLNGLTADCLISVVSFEGAEYSEFDSELIDAGTAVSIVGYIGDDEHVVIPDTIANLPVTEIGTDAFYDCLTMKSVEIPSSVVALGDYAFDSCLNLRSITIGSNIREIGVRCFYRCINLETVYYNSVSCRVNTNFFNQRAPFDGCSALEKCIISDDVIDIPQYLFYDLSSLKEVEMGNNVEYIGNRAFSSCDNLECICLPETLTSIGSYAFYGCSSLSNLILPENLYSISSYAFGNCSSIYSAIIPDSVSSIGSYAFSGCTNLTDISITNDIATVYESSFDNTAYFNDESNWENGILYIDNHLITGKADLINGVIKSGTVRIANSAFADNTSLTRITIPKTVEIIGTSAFSNCTGLTSAVIPTSVEQIESSAFTGCTSLGQVSVYNKDCVISNSSTVFPETTILCGYLNSTTQEYATNFSRTFVSLHEHDYSYVVKVEPTVMNEGYIECSCSCGDAITEAIPAIAQNCIVKNNMLIGFDQGLSVEELLEKYLVSNTATITLSRNVIGTGTTVEIINGDGFCEEYEIVIIGDVNGDSWHDGQDAVLVSSIVNGMLSESQIGSAAYTAADCNADGKVDDQDVALLQSAGLMIDEIDQTNTYGDSGSITVTFNGNGATDGTMESQGFEFGVEQNLKSNEYSRSYKIAYELNGGVAAITNANTDSVYSFKSWNSTQNGNGLYTYSNGEAVTNPKGYSSGNAELYAQWIGGGVRIPTPTKEYNEFVGWYTDSEFKNEFVITDSLYYPSDNITLYAKWQPHEFEVTFNDVFDFDTFDFSSALNGTVSVDKENKSVTLYSETFDTHTTNYADSTRGYMTLIPGHTYRFSYDWENLSDVDDTLHPYAFAYDSLEITELQMYNYYKLPAPARSSGVHVFTETIPEGHPFVTIRFGVAGSEQGGSIIKCSNIHIQDITNLDGVADDVSVPMNTDGETIFNVSVEYGNKVSSTDKLNGSLPTIRRTGYTFAGWYDSYDENGNGTGNLYDENSVMGATDMKLYAKWIKEE